MTHNQILARGFVLIDDYDHDQYHSREYKKGIVLVTLTFLWSAIKFLTVEQVNEQVSTIDITVEIDDDFKITTLFELEQLTKIIHPTNVENKEACTCHTGSCFCKGFPAEVDQNMHP